LAPASGKASGEILCSKQKPKTEKQMNAQLKSTLVDTMQKWLDDNADDIGSNLSIWQDTKPTGQNAHLMATAAETVLDAMALQSRLVDELGA
jgi:23S rRNA maturation mini-RNase III